MYCKSIDVNELPLHIGGSLHKSQKIPPSPNKHLVTQEMKYILLEAHAIYLHMISLDGGMCTGANVRRQATNMSFES